MGAQGIEICLVHRTVFCHQAVKPSSPVFGGSFHQPAFGIPFESLRLRHTWRSLQDFPETAGGWENTKRVKKNRFTCSTRHVVRVPLVGKKWKKHLPQKVWSIDFFWSSHARKGNKHLQNYLGIGDMLVPDREKRSLAKECSVAVVCFVGNPRSWSLGRHSHQRADAARSPHFEGRTQPQCLAFLLPGS